MAKRIYPLPPSLINQMAAGEVIERPASVVKELLENALDAQAHNITIQIEAAGIQLIEISDDGIGIHPEDLPLTLMNHATSKIRTLDDLFSIHSLGFRGEALASISAISRFSMVSKQKEHSEGYALTFDEIKQEIQLSPQARIQGTTVSVRDLFFNAPVRRQFLASEKTEWIQIENIVKRLALSRFDVAFHLKHNTSTVFNLPQISNKHITDKINPAIDARIKKIFGATFLVNSEFFDVEHHGIRLWGWLGLPSLMRSQNDYQYFYLNGRLLRDKLINHAVRIAYEGHLYPGRQPLFLLYLEMPPEQVDVNVHPTKHEVRFRDQRQIHDFIVNQLSQRLQEKKTISLPVNANKIKENHSDYTISPPSHLNLQWIEAPYCLIKSNQALFLCHFTHLYQSLCRQRFLREINTHTITTRPFLVPIRFTPRFEVSQQLFTILSALEALGLSLNLLDNNTFIIRTFPATLPYFDIHSWLICLEKWEKKEASSQHAFLIESLIQANQPPQVMSSHEIHAVLEDFQQYLTKPDLPADLQHSYKQMKPDDWANILRKK